MISIFDKVENIVRKGENDALQHFHLLLQSFQNPSLFGSMKGFYLGNDKAFRHHKFSV